MRKKQLNLLTGLSRTEFEEIFQPDLYVKGSDGESKFKSFSDKTIEYLTRVESDEFTSVIVHFDIIDSMLNNDFSFDQIGLLIVSLRNFLSDGTIPVFEDKSMGIIWDRAFDWLCSDKERQRHRTISNRIKGEKNRKRTEPPEPPDPTGPRRMPPDPDNESVYESEHESVYESEHGSEYESEHGSDTDSEKGKGTEGGKREAILELLDKHNLTLPKETVDGLLKHSLDETETLLEAGHLDQYKRVKKESR